MVSGRLVDAVDAESHVKDDACHIFAKIEKMGKGVAGVVVATITLNTAPDAGEGGEKAKKAGAGGVALGVTAPFVGV